jgi:hypothetical protein
MEIQYRMPAQITNVQVKLASTTGTQPDASLKAFVLGWWEQMRAGKIDRTLLSAEYDAHLSNEAVQGMSQHLAAYDFGAAPLGVHLFRLHSTSSQTFHLAKIVFPRGDAASLLFGCDRTGKITGVSLLGMAGD